MKLLNKKALITGANRSIGRAIAVAFARQGADVALSYHSDADGAHDTVAEIEKANRFARALRADFSHPGHPDVFFNDALNFLGRVDILVNCAGEYDTSPFLELEVDTFERLFQVGVHTPMRLIQLAAQQMIHNKISGSVINLSSISGHRPYPNRVAHSTAKAALNMLTQSTALELAPYNIRVNAIAPGATPYGDNQDAFVLEGIPLKRAGLPEDHAHAAVFLASEESAWMTGQVMTIDGGQSLSF
ncbi:MAG: putative oxidoreductase YohF [Chlamydiales bacterium]|nr:putative oxidoreductase YohF [Chlamydiales bacterium]